MLQSGTMIADRYEIAETVGAGGMSVVYKALDHRLNRYVAVKILKEEFSNDKTFVTKFRVEAQSAAGLSHPNIVNVYDVGDDEGIHYIVMEMVEGITLKEYIQKKGHLSVSEAVNFSLQIASGIEVAHENHIIHRDIKPQNIIVSPSGILKVTDFGIAKAATSATVSSNAIGSVHYISPEQARGGFSDERSDIYSLGITMYEMVTGRVPFEGDNNVTVALMHIQNEMIAPSEYYPDILPSFEKVIAKCTQKKPERRYLTANALIADLRRVESDPTGNFVKMNTLLDDAPTRMMGDNEVSEIKARASERSYTDEEDVQSELPEEEVEEEEMMDGDKMDPKLEKLAKVLGVIAAVLVVMLIIFLIAKAAGAFGTGGKNKKKAETTTEAQTTTENMQGEEKTLPSVVGDDVDTAKEKLAAEGFENCYTEYQESDEVEENKVISQSPEGNTKVNTEEEIKLIVSSGKSSVKVPDVTGYKSDNAKTVLTQEGFEVKFAYEYDDDVEEGKVIRQDPKGNTEAPKGSTITITVSQGKDVKEVTMVNLVGDTLENAKKKLDNLGLKYKITKAASDAYDKGEVIAQDHAKGEKVTTDTVIGITVSNGPDTSNVTYKGTYTLEDIMDAEVDSARLTVYLNGSSSPLYDVSVTHDDFPFPINVESSTSGKATITIYLDGEKKSTQSISLKASN